MIKGALKNTYVDPRTGQIKRYVNTYIDPKTKAKSISRARGNAKYLPSVSYYGNERIE